MKSKFFVACTLAMALLALTGCSNSKPEHSQASTKPDSDIPSDGSSSEAVTVSPLPTSIDLDHLDDCTVAVSFNEGDAFVDDTGTMQLRVKVYTYDLYDMVDISALKVGDQITICQQEVEVTSLEHTKMALLSSKAVWNTEAMRWSPTTKPCSMQMVLMT